MKQPMAFTGKSERTELSAGPVRMFLVNGELRYLRVGDIEVLRRIYVAVRDRLWRTIPPQISNLELEIGADRFHVTFAAAHRQGEPDFQIDFRWTGTITGDASGKITFTMDGEARSDFRRSRIGICVLHPPNECAGRPCLIEHPGSARARTTTLPS